MRVFFDVKYIENGPQIPIQPVSVGLVAEDGRELYVINDGCLSNAMRHHLVSVNLIPSLPVRVDVPGAASIFEWDREHDEYPHVLLLDTMARAVYGFLAATPDLSLWSYYGSHGHVVLLQLFGSLAELPAGIPLHFNELYQEVERTGLKQLPPEPVIPYHALYDARWNAELYAMLRPNMLVEFIPPLLSEASPDAGAYR